MGHNHNHNCSCDHERVKFCKTCRIVHCQDCNQEWTYKVTQWTYTQPYWQHLPNTGGLTYRLNDLQASAPTVELTSTCSHGGK